MAKKDGVEKKKGNSSETKITKQSEQFFKRLLAYGLK